MSSDLTDFLLKRIAEDEAVARAGWTRGAGMENLPQGWTDTTPDELREHSVRFGPVRVLAECDAKRRIVAEHPNMNADWDDFASCSTCEDRERHDAARWPCKTLRLLALPYADHPDYDPAWRPTD